ncbi:MAG: hypothetical protein HY862_17890 [Chloroflexi bacterium]|nr:hypothetical protein [Chloroflexota bacterium]
MRYHPEERIVLEYTVIKRDRALPPRAYGSVRVSPGANVESTHIIAEGELPQDFRIVDVAGPLNIDPDDAELLSNVLTVAQGDVVPAGHPLATPPRRKDRKKVPHVPVDGVVSLVEHGRVILQTNPQPVVVYARLQGRVTELIGNKGARIETVGSLIQGAWGNGRFLFSSFSFEPKDGLQSLIKQTSLLENVRGRVYILERPINVEDLRVVVKKELGGLVAPSMSYHLRETAMALKVPIILTEGFGEAQMTRRTNEILREFENKRQAAFDAMLPNRWTSDRPEIVIPYQAPGTNALYPAFDEVLIVGATVRLSRAPYEGQIATVTALPDKPQIMENGLRTAAAQVKLRNGHEVMVPLANIELLGESK